MTEQENSTKNLKFYSKNAIGIATFLGGPLAAGYVIRENYLSLNKPDEAKKSLLFGIIATVLLFTGIFIIPENIIEKVPNQLFPLIYTAIIFIIVEKIHGPILSQHKENGNDFHSAWKAAGIGFISLIILLVVIFGSIYLYPESEELEKYDTELELFTKNEEQTLLFYDHLNSKPRNSLIQELDNIAIPKWKENIKILKASSEIANLPTEILEQNKVLLKYSELRLEAFELFKKAISEDNDQYADELDLLHLEIEKQLNKLN